MHYIDLHCDTIYKLMAHPELSFSESPLCIDLKKLQSANSLAQFFACFIYAKEFDMDYDMGFKRVLDMLNYMKAQITACNEPNAVPDILPAYSLSDLKKNKEQNSVSAFFTVEEGGVLNGKPDRLDILYKEGIRLITLFWNYENSLGAPNSKDSSKMQRGLTSFGFEVVERMNDLGMLIDVSHASDGSFRDVIRTSKAPVLASHSNARTICPHPRNLSDEMLKALGERGGIAGLNFYPAFVNGTEHAAPDELVAHARHIANHAGIGALAIGSDFDGFEGSLTDLESADKIENLRLALRRGGFAESELDKIFYQNALRLMGDVLH